MLVTCQSTNVSHYVIYIFVCLSPKLNAGAKISVASGGFGADADSRVELQFKTEMPVDQQIQLEQFNIPLNTLRTQPNTVYMNASMILLLNRSEKKSEPHTFKGNYR